MTRLKVFFLLLLPMSVVCVGHGSQEECSNQKALFFSEVQDGDIPCVRRLLAYNQELIHARDDDNLTALHIATRKNHCSLVIFLLCEGVAVDITGGYWNATPLHDAVENGHYAIAACLLQWGADANKRITYQDPAIEKRRQCGYCRVCFDMENKQLVTPLHLAAAGGHNEVVKLLLEHGADVNAICFQNTTALHRAIRCGCLETVKELVHGGADVTLKRGTRETPLKLAIKHQKADIVDFLASHRDVQVFQLRGDSPLHYFFWDPAIARILLRNDAFVNAMDWDGSTPLHGELYPPGCRYSFRDPVLRVLLEHNADVNAIGGSKKRTPLHAYADRGLLEEVRLLINYDADLEMLDVYGRTPLRVAISGSRRDVVCILLACGACVDGVVEKLDRLVPQWRRIQKEAGVEKFEMLKYYAMETQTDLPRDLQMTILAFLCQTDVCQRIIEQEC